MYQQQFASYNPQQAAQQQLYAQRTGSMNFGAQQFATVGSPQPAQAAVAQWVPANPAEHQYYDVLFSMADEERRGAIGGRLAVAFFSRSKLDKLVLREVWSIADSMQRSELSRNEFYVAMRLISMAQCGEPVALQRFLETAQMPHPLPVLEGVPPPPAMPNPGAMAPPMAIPQYGTPVAAPAPHGAGGYAIDEEEKTRYDAIFKQYDADGDGFLLGSEAVALFQMSGLDRNALRDIWAMADRGQDSKLDLQEFYVAMHMIVCVSKRNLPLPPSLPQELHDSVFGSSAPAAAAPGQANQPAAQSPSGDPMDAFAELSAPVADAPLPSLSAPEPQRQASFHQEPPRQTSFRQEPAQPMHPADTAPRQAPAFSDSGLAPRSSGASVDGTRHESASGWPAAQAPQPPPAMPTPPAMSRDRTNSTSSMSSMSSFTGMAPPVRATGSNDRLNSMGGHPPIPHPLVGGGVMMGGVPTQQQQMHPPAPSSMGAHAYPTPALAAVEPKPFMSEEEEQSAVRELEQQNEQVADVLAKVESKQNAIESLAEKLRDLDQLRHELVTLVMKREKLRAATTTSAMASAPAEDPAEVQTRLTVERSLRELVDQEKQHVQKLQDDIARLETKLQAASGTGSDTGKLTATPSTASPTFAPFPSGSDGFDTGFGDFAGASNSSSGANAFSGLKFN